MSFTAAEANTIRIKTVENEERELPFAVFEHVRVVHDTKMCMYKTTIFNILEPRYIIMYIYNNVLVMHELHMLHCMSCL